jgi:hypothetical protein
VYEAAVQLVKAHHELQHEVAKLRFKSTFGTEACRNCEGLKAGPGVLATCFQVQACNYTNIKEGTNPRHLRILESFLRDDPKTP